MRIIRYVEKPLMFFRYLPEDTHRTILQGTLNQRRKSLNFNYKHIKNVKGKELCQIKHLLYDRTINFHISFTLKSNWLLTKILGNNSKITKFT